MKQKLQTIIKTALVFTFLLFSFVPKVFASCQSWCSSVPQGCNNPNCNTCPGCSTSTNVTNPSLPDWLNNLSGTDFLQRILVTGVNFGFFVGSLVFFFMFIIGGIKWITSGGDKTHLESAQKQLTHALIGLAILFAIFAIIQLIEYIFGVSLLNLTLPTL